MNKILLKAVNNAILKNQGESVGENILIGCVVYKQCAKAMTLDNDMMTSMGKLADSYVSTFKNIIHNMKNVYVSYSVIMTKISQKGLKSFLNIDERFLNEIYSLYLNKTMIKPFSLSMYSPNIYSIDDLSWEQNERLRNIHYNVMVPLAKYYINKNGIREDNIHIYSALVLSDIPGKGILFNIDGISLPTILTDLKRPSIGVWDYIYKAQTYEDMVLIILK